MTDRDTVPRDEPPRVGWFVIEVDVAHDREEPLFASVRGPFDSEEKAEREQAAQEEAWENALEEWDDGNPYDFKGWMIQRKLLYGVEDLPREDEESYEVLSKAAGAVGASLLADEGIGPMAGEADE